MPPNGPMKLAIMVMANVQKNHTLYLFLILNKMLIIRAGINIMLVRITNKKDPDQTAKGMRCLSMPVWQATSVRNY